jgi:hypothetical protein
LVGYFFCYIFDLTNKNNTMNKEIIIDKLIEQIYFDFEKGDSTVLAELLGFVPDINLLQGLPEEQWEDEDNEINLFEHYQLLPEEVQVILGKYDDHDNTYENCDKLIADLEAVGYTCEYGLDAEPYGLKRIVK